MKDAFNAIEHGIQLRVPLPFPLKYINSYLIPDESGYTLIDPGLNTVKAVEFWETSLQALSIPFSHIHNILLTHHHPDHYGLAGWFQERTEAPVWIASKGKQQIEEFWGTGRTMSEQFSNLFKLHGMDEAIHSRIFQHMEEFVDMVSPQPVLSELHPGDAVQLGGKSYETIETHGHAYGHLSFYLRDEQVIFCGDQILPQISPNVSLLPGMDDNPLASFLTSLEAMTKLDVKLAYPGHREPFHTFNARAQELIAHHNERLDAMKDKLAEPMTAYALCLDYFGQRLSLHQLRFAMSETLAHLVYLEQAGVVIGEEQAGKVLFRRI